MPKTEPPWEKAAQAIKHADALFLTAGAGMGVDSGLPDFRGDAGFWHAYPLFREQGLSFMEVAQPHWFRRDPELAWGFYGQRLNLYRQTTPHAGFDVLRRWAADKLGGAHVFTANVDGQFQRAGFAQETVCEVHGSIHHLQCSVPCSPMIWSAEDFQIAVDEKTLRAISPLPVCPRCGSLARPNVLMFNDGSWQDTRTAEQEERLDIWLESLRGASVVIIECGAGTAIATVRILSDSIARQLHATLIRINPREPEGLPGTLSFPIGAAAALTRLDTLVRG